MNEFIKNFVVTNSPTIALWVLAAGLAVVCVLGALLFFKMLPWVETSQRIEGLFMMVIAGGWLYYLVLYLVFGAPK